MVDDCPCVLVTERETERTIAAVHECVADTAFDPERVKNAAVACVHDFVAAVARETTALHPWVAARITEPERVTVADVV